MNCSICLETNTDISAEYHRACLAKLVGLDGRSAGLLRVQLGANRSALITDMPGKTHGLSISGMQIKAQARLTGNAIHVVETGGNLIVKPSPEQYPGLAENEHLSMKIMEALGFPVPSCGLLPLGDGHLVFVVSRYDRIGETKVHQEDAMAALGFGNVSDASKYESASLLELLEFTGQRAGLAVSHDLLMRFVASYLLGNGDHHLKNVSFLPESGYLLAPAYDVINTALYEGTSESVTALAMYPSSHTPFADTAYVRAMGNGMLSGGCFLEVGVAAGLNARSVKQAILRLAKRLEAKGLPLVTVSRMSRTAQDKYIEVVQTRLRYIKVFDTAET